MAPQNMSLQVGRLSRQNLESEAKFFAPFSLPLPSIVGNDRAFDLDTDGQAASDGLLRQTLRLSPEADGGPCDEHGANVSLRRVAGKPGILY